QRRTGRRRRNRSHSRAGARDQGRPAGRIVSAMKVALLYPEVYDMARFKDQRKEFPPFGVLYLAAVAEQAGHDVAVEAVTPGRPRLDLAEYDAVGFSLASSATYGLMLAARRDSALAAGTLIMVGG